MNALLLLESGKMGTLSKWRMVVMRRKIPFLMSSMVIQRQKLRSGFLASGFLMHCELPRQGVWNSFSCGYGKGITILAQKIFQQGVWNSFSCGFKEDGKVLELLHETQVERVPLALCQFKGRLLAGIGPVLRLSDLGKGRLLRKLVLTILQSFHYCKYRRDENQLYIFADDTVPRWLTAAHHIDFDTMAGADKFGDVYFVRLPQEVSDEIEEDPTGGKIKWEQGKLNGAPNKIEEIVQFHIGDVVTCLYKASLIPGGGECIIYGTVMGSLGALLPFTSRDDVDFFPHLEMHMGRSTHLCVAETPWHTDLPTFQLRT
ncbi:splicing factor 3B subunit 3-like [Olea europaea subsp. europaea]|uniref:Splicing factor 3B subunit 3-like n=1 Tax=Olea europaea subsp. europaea TaxID=158383 RepID=A0A8S0PNS5_OLEEU|nr:splicing factor 3B subunit 3-like [Olea europaea subsp. europaea]